MNPGGGGGPAPGAGGSDSNNGGSAGSTAAGTGGTPGPIGTGGTGGGVGGEAQGGEAGEGGEAGAAGEGPVKNLVENGDFEDGDSLWSVEPPEIAYTVTDGVLCFTLSTGQSAALSWPTDTSRAFPLKKGRSYALSLSASSSGPLDVSVTAKVGHAVFPYTAHFEGPLEIGTELVSRSYAFEVEEHDDGAGLLISVTGAQEPGTTSVCFDDVSVEQTP